MMAFDQAALGAALQGQGEAWYQRVAGQCPHLFSPQVLTLPAGRFEAMRAVVEAVERVAGLPGWGAPQAEDRAQGVFYGYDFHVDEAGVHLIEINTNAGGAYLNALLRGSQLGQQAQDGLETEFLAMFRNEWRRERGTAELACVAIVDEAPESQYLYPEFVLAQRVFERAGIMALIAGPEALTFVEGGVYCAGRRVDLVYNRLTDFDLGGLPQLAEAWRARQVVVTPHPAAYARYADKRHLVRLTDPDFLMGIGADAQDVAVLQAGVPQTRVVQGEPDTWWAERKQWFFKPFSGYGSKGAYRGDKLTRRVFDEVMKGGYIAQRLAPPGEHSGFKFDLRCYVYGGGIQLVAARLYQGQTTNFRTPGGGFALVQVG
jgi:hypothetical protein